MRRNLRILVVVGVLSIASTMTSFASWEQVGTQWKYSENNVYLTGWQWIDGNGDSVAECYYLDVNGILAVNTVIEGYTVNESGAWTVNDVVQTKAIGGSSGRSEGSGSGSSQNQSNSGIPSLEDIMNGTTSDFDMSNAQCGDSTGLPPLH